MEFPEFCVMMVKKMQESDTENEVGDKGGEETVFYNLALGPGGLQGL